MADDKLRYAGYGATLAGFLWIVSIVIAAVGERGATVGDAGDYAGVLATFTMLVVLAAVYQWGNQNRPGLISTTITAVGSIALLVSFVFYAIDFDAEDGTAFSLVFLGMVIVGFGLAALGRHFHRYAQTAGLGTGVMILGFFMALGWPAALIIGSVFDINLSDNVAGAVWISAFVAQAIAWLLLGLILLRLPNESGEEQLESSRKVVTKSNKRFRYLAGFVAALSITILVGFVLVARGRSPEITPVPPVDPDQQILFYNGVVLTMDPEQPQASALAVTGEKIEAVGSDDEILVLEEPGAVLVDLDGSTLMPGFVDPHNHLFNDAKSLSGMSLAEIQQVALEHGITTQGDLYVDKSFLREMQRFEEAGGLQIRTSLYLVANDNCGRSQGDWWKDHPATAEPGEMLRIGGVKIFADGGSCKGVALTYELVPGEGLGDLFFSQEELNKLVSEVQAEGRQVAIHAAGDRAIEQAQNAIAAALNGEPNKYRHRIEHNAIDRPELLPRYGEIGIVPLIFSRYEVCDREGPLPPEEYQSWEWPWREMMEANPGLVIAWHGDYRRSGRVQPLGDLYGLVTRNDVADDGTICPGYDWLKPNTLSVGEALPMMTINAAYALFRDDEVGSLEPGKYADLIVLSDNPLAVSPEQIPRMDVWLTMVGGRTAYCATGHESSCPE